MMWLMAKRVRRTVFWCAVLAVLVAALVPEVPPELTPMSWDKANHLGVFVVLALLGRCAYGGHWRRVLAGLLAFGALIEVLQSWMPPRTGEWGDLLADALGLGAAALMVWAFDRYFFLLKKTAFQGKQAKIKF
jgi:VanZ family protein